MKKNLWVLVLAAVIGFGMVSCDDGNGDGGGTTTDIFAGTWVAYDLDESDQEIDKVIAANGTLQQYGYILGNNDNSPGSRYWDELETYRATYKVSGNTVTITITEVNIGYIEWEEGGGGTPFIKGTDDRWLAYANLPNEMKQGTPQTYLGIISGNGNTLTVMDMTYTKK